MEAVTQLSSSHNANKLAARGTADPENSDNSDSGKDDEENDRRNRVTIHESYQKLFQTKVTLLENCKFPQAKHVNPVVFASSSPSTRSTDVKLQEVHRIMSKMTACFIKLLFQLPNILILKLDAIQTIVDGIKMSGYATQNLQSIKKNFYCLV